MTFADGIIISNLRAVVLILLVMKTSKRGWLGSSAKITLKVIAAAGIVSVAVLAPNALQAFKILDDSRRSSQYKRKYHLSRIITNLKNKGLVYVEDKKGQKFVRLTKKGEKLVKKLEIDDVRIKKPKQWDKKWRVVIFDIKEHRKNARNNLRKHLQILGFVKLQNSVWVIPYECDEVIALLKAFHHIGKDVLYMVVDKIENDRWLRQEFSLK